MSSPERRWPWFQQVVDAATAGLGIGIGISCAVRDSWQPMAVVVILACVGKLGTSTVYRILLGRWEGKP